MDELAPFTPAKAYEIMEAVLIRGDLSRLNPQERANYYVRVCQSVGLNPMTKPFEYLTLNGRLVLYALKACTDQLRSIHKISVTELTRVERDGAFIVTAKMIDGTGRTDADIGAVNIAGLQGDALANAMMKAATKAKRRATLSLCGLGLLDELEVETIPDARPQQVPRTNPKTVVPAPKHRLKEGGIADQAMIARVAPAHRSSGPSRPFLASEAGRQLNRHLHPMNDELPDHSAPPTISHKEQMKASMEPLNHTERDGIPDFCDRRKAQSQEPSYVDLYPAE
jgi:hypothetical protein